MNQFTLANTKDATEFYLGSSAYLEFFVTPLISHEESALSRLFCNSRLADTPVDHYVSLLRPHNETREFWTTNCVTKYALGNKMNTDEMIPISFSRNITPLVMGEVLINCVTGRTFEIDCQSQLDVFNTDIGGGHDYYAANYFVVSFADRPNTGKQPVSDDVEVYYREFHPTVGTTASKRKMASEVNWDGLGFEGECPCVRTVQNWKPNHAAMLKQWQESQLKNDSDMAPQVKPVFTKAMADAGLPPYLGSLFMVNGDENCDDGFCRMECVAYHHNGGVIGLDDRGVLNHISGGYVPIQTDEDKCFEDLNNVPRIFIEDVKNLIADIKAGKIHGVKWVGK